MRVKLLAALIAIAGLGATASAQPFGPGGPGCQARGRRMYDPSTVTTVSGQVTSIERRQAGRGQGVHALLKSSGGNTEVMLGPSWYLDQQELKIAAGDDVVVTGSKVQLASGTAVVARVVKKGDQSLTLRDADGVPAWAGRRASGGGPGPCGCAGGNGCRRTSGAQGGFGGT